MKKLITLSCLLCSALIFATGSCPPIDNSCYSIKIDPAKSIEITNNKGLYIIRIPKERNANIRPYVTKYLTYNKNVYAQTRAELVINAGYFDPNNKKTTSYVIIDKKLVLDPTTNKSLMSNKAVKPYIDTVLNRTEFRVLDCHGKTKYDIAPHDAKTPFRCSIKHSIQAGPMIYPDLKLSREYFVVKDKNGKVIRDSITALKKCARTAIGIKDGDVYIIIANIYHKLTLPELYKICEDLGLEKAMNFDGGGSTSLNYRGTDNPQYKNFEITSDKNKNARRLKSFLVID